jgi:putative DNA primase/helicase
LTVLRAFHVAGRPAPEGPPLGSFEDWSGLVRNALIWLGEPDPCATMDRARADDPRRAELSNVIHQWTAVIGENRLSTAEVIDIATKRQSGGVDLNGAPRPFLNPAFRESLLIVAGDGGNINSRRLGKWLSSIKDRIVDGRRIKFDGVNEGARMWTLK